MSYTDPNRPVDPMGNVPPRTTGDPHSPRLDDWSADRPGSSSAIWAGAIIAAVIIIGAIAAMSGKVENSGVANNTTPAPTATTRPAPTAPAPATTGQAPAR